MRFSVASIVAVAFAGVASACPQLPVGSNPSGNPIALPSLGQIVPAEKPFTITWNPTTPGKVSIVLLRGPSENVIPIDCLADSIANTGTFSWTPSTGLTPDTTHYGLQIIVTGTGQFQYSTQFGISNPEFSSTKSASVTPIGSTTAKTSDYPITQIKDGQVQVPTSAVVPSLSPSPSANATFTPIKPIGTGVGTAPSASYPTGGFHNATRLLPTKSMTVPPSLRTQTATLGVTSGSAPTGSSSGTTTPATANPNGAGRAFAASGLLGALGVALALMF